MYPDDNNFLEWYEEREKNKRRTFGNFFTRKTISDYKDLYQKELDILDEIKTKIEDIETQTTGREINHEEILELDSLKEELLKLNNSSAINNKTDKYYLKKINYLIVGKKYEEIIPK